MYIYYNSVGPTKSLSGFLYQIFFGNFFCLYFPPICPFLPNRMCQRTNLILFIEYVPS